jgi:CLIP-associating protein 1/2
MIPIIINAQISKSKEIRRSSYELLNQLMVAWETHCLEKHIQLLINSIKKGIADADQDARSFSRKAFWSFHSHFPQQANKVLESLDSRTQNLLNKDSIGSQFGSQRSLKEASLNSLSCDIPDDR